MWNMIPKLSSNLCKQKFPFEDFVKKEFQKLQKR